MLQDAGHNLHGSAWPCKGSDKRTHEARQYGQDKVMMARSLANTAGASMLQGALARLLKMMSVKAIQHNARIQNVCRILNSLEKKGATLSPLGNENSAQSFSNRSFWKSLRVVDVRAFGSWMSAPKCLFFQDFDRSD